MQKRRDDFLYADLHKCLPTMFLTAEEAEAALNADPELAPHRNVAELVAATMEDWDSLIDELAAERVRNRRLLEIVHMAAEVGDLAPGGKHAAQYTREDLRRVARGLLADM